MADNPISKDAFIEFLRTTGKVTSALQLSRDVLAASEGEAQAMVEDAGFVFRVVPLSEERTATDRNRVSVEVVDGFVVAAWVG